MNSTMLEFFSKGAELICLAVTMLVLVWDSYLLATAFLLAQSSIDSLGNSNPSKIFPLSMCRMPLPVWPTTLWVLILNRIYPPKRARKRTSGTSIAPLS